MSDEPKEEETGAFVGTGIILWLQDGKMKFRYFDSQSEMDTERERLLQVIPPRLMCLGYVNWSGQKLFFSTWEPDKEVNHDN